VKLETLAAETEGWVGADLEGLCHRAALLAIHEYLEEHGGTGTGTQEGGEVSPLLPGSPAPLLRITARHFEQALANRHRKD